METKRNYLHVLWRVPAFLLWLICMPILFFVLRALKVNAYRDLPHTFHRGIQLILGLRVTFGGARSSIKPTLFVSNHISYLDIFVLGEIRAFYIAKSEVANWPVLGPLARFQNTLFFERKAGRARQQLEVMQAHLSGGNNLIFFPEGTSTDGAHVEPFKSSLFEAANLDGSTRVAIQPVTVVYTRHAGQAMDQAVRDNYAWYADMPFTSHFLNLFTLKKVDVKVHFHPVTYIDEFATRKECAEHCFNLVNEKLIQVLLETK
jgi:1-acyl-sn-glycerol-3-phosphate acyltransferase